MRVGGGGFVGEELPVMLFSDRLARSLWKERGRQVGVWMVMVKEGRDRCEVVGEWVR